jgi:hypothetical protein
VVLFDSVHHVLAAEKRLRSEAIWIDLIPVPRSLSSDCGMAIAFRMEALSKVQDLLSTAGLRWHAIYQADGEGYSKVAP